MYGEFVQKWRTWQWDIVGQKRWKRLRQYGRKGVLAGATGTGQIFRTGAGPTIQQLYGRHCSLVIFAFPQ